MTPIQTASMIFCFGGLLAMMTPPAHGAGKKEAEQESMRRWTKSNFEAKVGDPKSTLPFSFTYGGRDSKDLLKTWKLTRSVRKRDAQRTERTLTWRDPQSGLEVRCSGVDYNDFPTVEWTLYFKNRGTADTPVLSDIRALDMRIERGAAGEFLLHHSEGSTAVVTDYAPKETRLEPKAEQRFATRGGRGSDPVLPYFNVEQPEGGVILAIGWPGQWAAQFTRDDNYGLQVRAGQETTRFLLHPGEEVRSPLIAMQFYKGDWLHGQNVWRRWMLAYNVPRPGGKLLPPTMFACSSHQFGEMIHANEENQKLFIDRYLAEKLPLDCWWMDAGWYVNNGNWVNTGTWEVDKARFPNGLRAVSDHAHARGVKTLVWFEPERVTPGTWLYDNHPDWLLTAPPDPKNQNYEKTWRLLDLGNPAAHTWLTDHVDKFMTEQAVDFYRQDFNMDPLFYWQAHDAPDRQGITENHDIAGYLSYWDELARRHPNMPLDSCASGGRRNDLESMRRAIPRTRSDYLLEPVGEQCHTYGISLWLPYSGTGFMDAVTYQDKKYFPEGVYPADDAYLFRSVLCTAIINCCDVRKSDLHYDMLRRLFTQWREVSPNLLGDYYPLTPFSTAKDVWMAWQFDRPERGEGMVQAFRRSENGTENTQFKLHGLQADARYSVRNADAADSQEKTGAQLMQEGLSVTLRHQPEAAVILYKRIAK